MPAEFFSDALRGAAFTKTTDAPVAQPLGALHDRGWNLGTRETSIMSQHKFDTHIFIAGAAIRTGQTFHVTCKCGGRIPVTPPLSTSLVVCPGCHSTMKMLVDEGDTGFIIGATPEGQPMLIPVQGSSKSPDDLSPEERDRILKRASQHME